MLKDAAIEFIEHIKFDEYARSIFESERVREQLGCVMDLVIKSLTLIAQYFSKPYWSAFSSYHGGV